MLTGHHHIFIIFDSKHTDFAKLQDITEYPKLILITLSISHSFIRPRISEIVLFEKQLDLSNPLLFLYSVSFLRS